MDDGKPVHQMMPDFETLDREPEEHFETSAWELAEVVCKAQLVRTDASAAKGLKRIGERSFSKWVDAVEKAVEQENPDKD